MAARRIGRQAKPTASSSQARERIIHAAMEVFGSLGYSKATVHQIASTADLSKPIFYRHFENKSDVFGVVIERVCKEWYETLETKVEETRGETAESLQAIFRGTLEHTRSRPLLQRLLTRDSQVVIWSETDLFDRTRTSVSALIARVLAEGRRNGQVRADLEIDHLADAVNELVSAYAIRQLVPGVVIDPGLEMAVASFIASGIAPRHAGRTDAAPPL